MFPFSKCLFKTGAVNRIFTAPLAQNYHNAACLCGVDRAADKCKDVMITSGGADICGFTTQPVVGWFFFL